MPTFEELCRDLRDEQVTLDEVFGGLVNEDWARPTPAEGWDVRDSLSHLCFFEEAAVLAVTEPVAFEAHKVQLFDDMAAGRRPDVELGRMLGHPREVLERWHVARRTYEDAVSRADSKLRVPWYGPSMSPASFTTARIMETWAHGADVRDALSIPIEPSGRLRHVCHIGYGARAYSFMAHGVDDPGDPVRMSVTAPGGGTWSWGPEDATNRITGTSLDVALVFTQRRHRSRTDVQVTGEVAETWLSIAQAFAGPSTVTALGR
ncbi:MAG: TIGR03084 family protein [Acidimicrobiales bacterium]|nr:TIGR03084 family protein [Acidimicrobiales bacterium]